MAEGKNCIMKLNNTEYKAAMAAIKLVRSNDIKNAYIEGWEDGYRACAGRYRGEMPVSDLDGWEKSHAKTLSVTSGQE